MFNEGFESKKETGNTVWSVPEFQSSQWNGGWWSGEVFSQNSTKIYLISQMLKIRSFSCVAYNVFPAGAQKNGQYWTVTEWKRSKEDNCWAFQTRNTTQWGGKLTTDAWEKCWFGLVATPLIIVVRQLPWGPTKDDRSQWTIKELKEITHQKCLLLFGSGTKMGTWRSIILVSE